MNNWNNCNSSTNTNININKYIVNFDPSLNSWSEEILKTEIPVLYANGDLEEYEAYLVDKAIELKKFKLVKSNYLDSKGKSRNQIPYFMCLIKGLVIYQFSGDNINNTYSQFERFFEFLRTGC
jgi:hypothetical protein